MRRKMFCALLTLVVLGLVVPAVRAEEDPVRDENQSLAEMWKNQSPTVYWWESKIYEWAKVHDLNPNVVATIMQMESCGWTEPASDFEKAQGLFQVMPFHFSQEYKTQMQNPEINALVGLDYFSYLYEKSGNDLRLAFAAYNGGPSKLNTPQSLWPEETKRYYYWSQIAIDAIEGEQSSKVLDEWLTTDGGRLCKSAEAWQKAHQKDGSSVKQPGIIVIDVPPVIWVVFLLVLGVVIQKKGGRRWGSFIVNLTTGVVIVVWLPLNLFDENQRAYTNIIFETRRWFDGNPGIGRVIDYVKKGEEVGIPVPDTVKSIMTAYEKINTVTMDISLWVSNDPLLTPAVHLLADFVWDGMYLNDKTVLPGEIVGMAAPFHDPVQVRIVQDARLAINRWGVHGNFCFSCLGWRSWLGTDVNMYDEQQFYAPFGGTVERVIVNGGADVGRSSVWVTAKGERFAVLHLNSEDAAQFHVGDIVLAGQALGRQDPEYGHIHVVLEIQNPDGSWGDYPLLVVMEATGVKYVWYDMRSSYVDLYVPKQSEMTDRSVYLQEVIP